MRITGGAHRGRKIKCIAAKNLRPTSSKVREAIFSVIGQDLSNQSFCDAFAGSGIMGFEAYSRGSNFIGFAENNIRAMGLITSTITTFNDGDRFTTARNARTLISSRLWDIIFLDPPYSLSPQPTLLSHINQAKKWVIETSSRTQVEAPDG